MSGETRAMQPLPPVKVIVKSTRRGKTDMLFAYEAERQARLDAAPYTPFWRGEVPAAFRRATRPATAPPQGSAPTPETAPILAGHPF